MGYLKNEEDAVFDKFYFGWYCALDGGDGTGKLKML